VSPQPKTLSLYNVANARFIGDARLHEPSTRRSLPGLWRSTRILRFRVFHGRVGGRVETGVPRDRRKNFIQAGQVPPFAQIVSEGKETARRAIVTCGLEECLSRGMEEIGWNECAHRKVLSKEASG